MPYTAPHPGRASLKNALLTACLLAGLLFFSFWLMFHTFSYDPKIPAMLISTKAWSDFGAHIPLIRSFSLGDNWPPQYPLFPGEPIRYHFLFYFLVGMLEKTGLRIDWALNLPSALGFFLLVVMIYLLGAMLFADRRVGIVSVVFFLFNGSLAFLRFFVQHPVSVHTPNDIAANVTFPAFAPWGPGEITAFWNLNIYTNQRHLALAFGLGLLIIYLCLRLETKPFKRQLPWIPLVGLLLGVFPYLHQPTLLILGIFFAVYFLLFPRLRWFLLASGILASFLIVPQLVVLTNGPNLVTWYPGYLIHDSLTFPHFVSYWWQNLGLHGILIMVGFLVAPGWMKRAILPIFAVFAAANLFKFSPEVAASHKFFNFFLILGNILSAWMVVRGLNIAKNFPRLVRLFTYPLIGLLFLLLTLSGVIDFFPIYNDPKGPLIDIPANRTATWIEHHTDPSSIVLNSSFLYNPASLAGRKIFLGWPYFAWSAGYDTYKRLAQQQALWEAADGKTLCELLRLRQIDYVLLENPGQQREFTINWAVYSKTLPQLFETNELGRTFTIYEGKTACNGE